MIKVDRNRIPEPVVLRSDEDSPGNRESAAATRFYLERKRAREEAVNIPNDQKPFQFSVYKSPPVKNALRILFEEKCAYCENDYGGAAWDVEHFRPKGAIDYYDANGHRLSYPEGYFWLAADWNNLFYSCQHCNREENHVHGLPREDAPRVSGKGNYFPLRDEQYRLTLGDSLEKEEPHRLLLNPCLDDPSEHLDFLDDGIVLATSKEGQLSEKGIESIKYYGLQRVELIEKRAQKALVFKFVLEHLKTSIKEATRNPEDEAAGQKLKQHLEVVSTFLSNRSPFLALVRKIYEREIQSD